MKMDKKGIGIAISIPIIIIAIIILIIYTIPSGLDMIPQNLNLQTSSVDGVEFVRYTGKWVHPEDVIVNGVRMPMIELIIDPNENRIVNGDYHFNVKRNWNKRTLSGIKHLLPIAMFDPTGFKELEVIYNRIVFDGDTRARFYMGFIRRETEPQTLFENDVSTWGYDDLPFPRLDTNSNMDCYPIVYKGDMPITVNDLIVKFEKISEYEWKVTDNKGFSNICSMPAPASASWLAISASSTGFGETSVSGIITKMQTDRVIISPNLFQPGRFSDFVANIKAWISRIFDNIVFFAIAGNQVVMPGSTQTYDITLEAPTANLVDVNWGDGSFAEHYCSAGLVNKNGDVIDELPFESCGNTWQKTYIVQVPQNLDEHAIIALMVETKQQYNFITERWDIVGEANTIIAQESMNLEGIIAPPTPVTPASIESLLAKFWSWLVSLFS